MTYTYEDVHFNNLQFLIARIEDAVGAVPTSASSGAVTEVEFEEELSPEAKEALDALMEMTDIDVIPQSQGTIFNLGLFHAYRDSLRESTGLNFQVYPQDNDWLIHFDKQLDEAEKLAFRQAVDDLLTEA